MVIAVNVQYSHVWIVRSFYTPATITILWVPYINPVLVRSQWNCDEIVQAFTVVIVPVWLHRNTGLKRSKPNNSLLSVL